MDIIQPIDSKYNGNTAECNAQYIFISDVHIQQHHYADKSYAELLATTRDVTRKSLPSSEDTNMVEDVRVNQGKAVADGECNVIGPGPLFTKKTPSYQYRDSHYKPETVVRPS